jgi:hypothetical protein
MDSPTPSGLDSALAAVEHTIAPRQGRRERLASWAGRRVDDLVRQALRRLFLRRGVPLQTKEELERSFAMLRCYTDPDVVGDPDRLMAPPSMLPELVTRSRRKIREGTRAHLEFESPYEPIHPIYAAEFRRYDKLDRVHLFAWQHARPAPASIVITHGWGLGPVRIHAQEFGIEWLYRKLGLDVYYYVAPFHWLRRPTVARFSGELHPSPNLMRTNEAFIQTTRELRTAFGLIQRHNPAPLGMMGSSLGGYTTALLASLDERIRFAVPVLPPSSLADLFWEHGAGDPVRARAETMGMTQERFRGAWALHSPLSHRPKVPFDGRLIVSATGDGLVGEHNVEPLWEHWGRPTRVRFAGGHILQVYRAQYHRALGSMLGRIGVIAPSRLAKLGIDAG